MSNPNRAEEQQQRCFMFDRLFFSLSRSLSFISISSDQKTNRTTCRYEQMPLRTDSCVQHTSLHSLCLITNQSQNKIKSKQNGRIDSLTVILNHWCNSSIMSLRDVWKQMMRNYINNEIQVNL